MASYRYCLVSFIVIFLYSLAPSNSIAGETSTETVTPDFSAMASKLMNQKSSRYSRHYRTYRNRLTYVNYSRAQTSARLSYQSLKRYEQLSPTQKESAYGKRLLNSAQDSSIRSEFYNVRYQTEVKLLAWKLEQRYNNLTDRQKELFKRRYFSSRSYYTNWAVRSLDKDYANRPPTRRELYRKRRELYKEERDKYYLYRREFVGLSAEEKYNKLKELGLKHEIAKLKRLIERYGQSRRFALYRRRYEAQLKTAEEKYNNWQQQADQRQQAEQNSKLAQEQSQKAQQQQSEQVSKQAQEQTLKQQQRDQVTATEVSAKASQQQEQNSKEQTSKEQTAKEVAAKTPPPLAFLDDRYDYFNKNKKKRMAAINFLERQKQS